ncbi:unnamed protein product [Urochloa humidicola]
MSRTLIQHLETTIATFGDNNCNITNRTASDDRRAARSALWLWFPARIAHLASPRGRAVGVARPPSSEPPPPPYLSPPVVEPWRDGHPCKAHLPWLPPDAPSPWSPPGASSPRPPGAIPLCPPLIKLLLRGRRQAQQRRDQGGEEWPAVLAVGECGRRSSSSSEPPPPVGEGAARSRLCPGAGAPLCMAARPRPIAPTVEGSSGLRPTAGEGAAARAELPAPSMACRMRREGGREK